MITYLAAPYWHHEESIRKERLELVNKVAAKLIEQGETIFSPLTYEAGIKRYLPATIEYDSGFWHNFDLTFLAKCDRLIVLTLEGWEESVGVTLEIEFARENDIGIFYAPLPYYIGFDGTTKGNDQTTKTDRGELIPNSN